MRLNHMNLTKADAMRYVGSMSQIIDARPSILTDGKADGVKIIDVKNGSGLDFTVIPGRCMDIAWASYKGIPLAHISKTGIVKPELLELSSYGFLRNFFCGLITTCGLTSMGSPCVDEGQQLGLHGRISNTPAEEVNISKEWEGDEYVIRISGNVRESCVFNENLVLKRIITVYAGRNEIQIKDLIENQGFQKQPLMYMYHCNFGYPLIGENTRLMLPEKNKVTARDEAALKGIEVYDQFQKPEQDYKEQVFYHDLPEGKQGYSCACLYNEDLSIGAYVKMNKKELPVMVEWKMMGEGDYVVGLEPSTNYPEGRKLARERGQLNMILPGECMEFNMSIGVIECKEEYQRILTMC